MTRNESRWAQIVFWNMEDIIRLHRLEIRREQNSDTLVKSGKAPIETWDLRFVTEMEDRASFSPYWDRSLTESDRKVRMDAFLRAIYPIWKPIMGSDAHDFADMSALHKADLAIYRRNTKPNRGNVGRPKDRALDEAPRAGND